MDWVAGGLSTGPPAGQQQRRSMCRQEEEEEEEGINTDRFPPRLKHRKDEDAGRWEIWW